MNAFEKNEVYSAFKILKGEGEREIVFVHWGDLTVWLYVFAVVVSLFVIFALALTVGGYGYNTFFYTIGISVIFVLLCLFCIRKKIYTIQPDRDVLKIEIVDGFQRVKDKGKELHDLKSLKLLYFKLIQFIPRYSSEDTHNSYNIDMNIQKTDGSRIVLLKSQIGGDRNFDKLIQFSNRLSEILRIPLETTGIEKIKEYKSRSVWSFQMKNPNNKSSSNNN